VIAGSLAARHAWINTAASLHAIRAEGLYELLGYERFTDWIADPDVSMGRSQAYALTAIYQELVIERDISVEDIQYHDPSKLAEVIPAIRKGTDPKEALADAAVLSRSDLRAKYRGVEPEPEKPVQVAICETCGQEIRA
jgi:hypothetical protein